MPTSWHSAQRFIRRLIREGRGDPELRRIGATSWLVSMAGDCLSPVLRTMYGRPEGTNGKWFEYKPGGRTTMVVDTEVRCRKCESCLRARQRHWSARASAEILGARRTWFGTVTLTPEAHYLALTRARAAAAAKSEDLDTWSESEVFSRRVAAIRRDLQLWLKRVRALSGARIRYLVVAEAHKSGLPHFHLLVHEGHGGPELTYRQLRDSWKLGFTQWKLADEKSRWYVTKYLAKSMLARVVASLEYGAAQWGGRMTSPALSIASEAKRVSDTSEGAEPFGGLPQKENVDAKQIPGEWSTFGNESGTEVAETAPAPSVATAATEPA